ncbi:electron transport complex subunit RsxG [Aliidiomarina haloalkalitolerans]|uniref:Ion-translocating oxidoreductase complex subunit G n=1 Tax=Aliidiomarina haloalkalitolerans TaxID=859059 RepID=A0A432VXE9_9GAMM|nr:electron transport complex subunit RsxG [Aliidiomarina haloalkalitolerans]RUO21370.1 electron transport complex subunit RsxG [Aliidiomarina haloalkalitolerans]
MLKSMRKNGLILGGFAVVATALVVTTQVLTADRIAEQQRNELMRTLNELIPPALHDNDLYRDCALIQAPEALGLAEQPVYRSRLASEPNALAIRTTAPDGYSGAIHLLVAVNLQGQIKGVRVLQHRETPGLGDKIEVQRDDWILSFNGERVRTENDARWRVRRDGGMFDQFTGATITPRAVIAAVQRTAWYAQNNMDSLFAAPANCIGEPLANDPLGREEQPYEY